jgi:hypothetical protein
MIKVKCGSWTKGQFSGYLFKSNNYGSIMHLKPGKTKKQALRDSAKELRRLAKICDEMAKDADK